MARSATWFPMLVEGEDVGHSRSCLHTVLHALAPSTLSSYLQQLGLFFTWYKDIKWKQPPLLVPAFDLMLFLTTRAQGAISPSSLDAFLAAFAWLHVFVGAESPQKLDFVQTFVKGLKRTLARPTVRKAPLTLDILTKILKLYAHEGVNFNDLRCALLTLLGFLGFFRCDELLALKVSDVKLAQGRSFISIFVAKSKADQLRQGHEVVLAASGDELCPVRLLFRYCRASGIKNPDEFLFQSLKYVPLSKSYICTGKPLSYNAAREALKDALKTVGEDPERFGTHSMRAGGATAAARSGITGRLLQAHGRWAASKSKDTYIVDDLDARLSVSRNILKK